jgi:NAD(P)-dependent dehydrogenase (short-subunit alcohol dehydrogenase family)
LTARREFKILDCYEAPADPVTLTLESGRFVAATFRPSSRRDIILVINTPLVTAASNSVAANAARADLDVEGVAGQMLKGLKGKSIVVTGAAGGIGEAICRRMTEEGAKVVAADIDADKAKAVAADIGNGAVGISADVSTRAGAQATVDAAVEAFGRLDLYHANAGVEGNAHNVVDFDIEVYNQVFSVNVLGCFLAAQAALKQFASQGGGGSILFTSSLAALMGTPGTAVYNASKHAVHGLMRCVARENNPGIRINMLSPGVVDTRMMRSLEASMGGLSGLDAETFKGAMEAAVPMGRYATPEEIAAAAAWILSDEVPYMHGEVVTVGGGLTP